MPRYCPAGDGAFDDWLDDCPECGRALVDDPVDEHDPKLGDGLVWLITAPNEPEANLWAEVVRATDIPVFIRAGGPGVGAWASVSSFEHELLVRERDLIRARRVVREMLNEDPSSSAGFRLRRAAPVRNAVRKRGS